MFQQDKKGTKAAIGQILVQGTVHLAGAQGQGRVALIYSKRLESDDGDSPKFHAESPAVLPLESDGALCVQSDLLH